MRSQESVDRTPVQSCAPAGPDIVQPRPAGPAGEVPPAGHVRQHRHAGGGQQHAGAVPAGAGGHSPGALLRRHPHQRGPGRDEHRDPAQHPVQGGIRAVRPWAPAPRPLLLARTLIMHICPRARGPILQRPFRQSRSRVSSWDHSIPHGTRAPSVARMPLRPEISLLLWLDVGNILSLSFLCCTPQGLMLASMTRTPTGEGVHDYVGLQMRNCTLDLLQHPAREGET